MKSVINKSYIFANVEEEVYHSVQHYLNMVHVL